MNTYKSARWAVTVAMVAGVMLTAACGTDTTSPAPPANPPAEARIYPPTDVPEVRPGFISADAAERHFAQNEEKQRRASGRPLIP